MHDIKDTIKPSSRNYRIDQPLECLGEFWVPGMEKERTIYGRLVYQPDSEITLELLGYLNTPTHLNEGLGNILILHGQLSGNLLVTLDQCRVTNIVYGTDTNNRAPTTVQVSRMILGEHLNGLDELQLKKYRIVLSSLSNWMGGSPIQSQGLNTITIEPRTITVEPPPNPKFNLTIEHLSTIHQTKEKHAFHWEAALTICAHDYLPFAEMFDIAYQCKNLLSLLIGGRTSIRQIEMFSVESKDGEFVPPLNLISSQTDEPDCLPIFLPYTEIDDIFPQIIKKWFERQDQEVIASNLFFSIDHTQLPFIDMKFLAMTQTLDAYCRSLGSDVLYMDQSKYDELIKGMIDNIPKEINGDHRTSFKKRIEHGNEFSLRKRLSKLLDQLPEEIKNFIIANDQNRFVHAIVETRNYYTHFDQSSKNKILVGTDCLIASERLRVLIIAHLLQNLGVKTQTLLQKFQPGSNIMKWASKPLSIEKESKSK